MNFSDMYTVVMLGNLKEWILKTHKMVIFNLLVWTVKTVQLELCSFFFFLMDLVGHEPTACCQYRSYSLFPLLASKEKHFPCLISVFHQPTRWPHNPENVTALLHRRPCPYSEPTIRCGRRKCYIPCYWHSFWNRLRSPESFCLLSKPWK